MVGDKTTKCNRTGDHRTGNRRVDIDCERRQQPSLCGDDVEEGWSPRGEGEGEGLRSEGWLPKGMRGQSSRASASVRLSGSKMRGSGGHLGPLAMDSEEVGAGRAEDTLQGSPQEARSAQGCCGGKVKVNSRKSRSNERVGGSAGGWSKGGRGGCGSTAAGACPSKVSEDGMRERRAVQQRIATMLLFLVLALSPAAGQQTIDPVYKWDVDITKSTVGSELGAVTAIAMPHYACANAPGAAFCPGCEDHQGENCEFGQPAESCENCNNKCQDLDVGTGVIFPAKCMPRLQALENRASPLGTWFEHRLFSPGPNNTIIESAIGPDNDAAPVGTFTFSATVRWGYLDIFNLLSRCTCCEFSPCDTTFAGSYGIARFQTTGEVLEEIRSIELQGTFAQLKAALTNMSFTSMPLLNDLRIRHNKLSPVSSRVQPYFQVDYRGPETGAVTLDLTAPANFSQLIHVVPMNDAPQVTDPQKGWVRGCITQPPCDTTYSLFEYEGPNYHFGQYWRWEGSSEPIVIRGITVQDPDVDETCIYNPSQPDFFIQDPDAAYFCGKLDFSVKALIGVLGLNSRDDLSIYASDRSTVGFTATSKFLTAAVRGVSYRVELPELIEAGLSEVVTSNTQYVNGPEEFIFVQVADQGLTGASGIAQSARDENGNIGLRINVTIAAVNNAPTLDMPVDMSAVEDTPIVIQGVQIFDVDSDEVTSSSLAYEDWLGERWNKYYLNRIRVTLQLEGYSNKKGRGFIFLSPTARNLFIVSNEEQHFLSIESLFPTHDTCASWEKIRQPGEDLCSEASIPRLAGTACSAKEQCDIVGEGSGLAGSDNFTVVLTGMVDPILDNEIKSMPLSFGVGDGSLVVRISSGPGAGHQARILTYTVDVNNTVDTVNVYTADMFPEPYPDAGSNWTIHKLTGGGDCEYAGVKLQDVCAYTETTPELSKLRLSSCEGDSCTCMAQDTCSSDGKVLLFLNRTKGGVEEYITELTQMFAGSSKTCGGLPLSRAAYPMNHSLGKMCVDNSSCSDAAFPKCTPGVDCTCCTNTSVVCSTNEDCKTAGGDPDEDTGYEAIGTPWCGCTRGIEPPEVVQETGAFCCANLTANCTTNSDCDQFLNGSTCGCVPGHPICGPFRSPINSSLPYDPGYGVPCVFRGVFKSVFNQETLKTTVEMYGSDRCDAPVFSYEGTRNARIFEALTYLQNEFDDGTLDRGSTRIEFYAVQQFVNLALKDVVYLTNNPAFPKYNRKYRIPEADRDPTSFKIEADDFDVLSIAVNDMGNSGGGLRDVREASGSFPIVVSAVNNPPEIKSPNNFTCLEDKPCNILHDPAAGLEGVFLTDPDQTDYGFNDPRIVTVDRTEFSLGFMVNLTVENGCLFVNEDFLRNGPEYATRGSAVPGLPGSILGGPSCSLSRGFDLDPPGCTIRLKDYGQARRGLHAYECVDQFCADLVFNPCYSDDNTINKPHCYGRVCTKFLAFEGRFPDINKVLSNITYLSDPDFNTYYGYEENLKISISDNGLVGDSLNVPSYTASKTMPIIVTPVNDSPRIGRLVDATCVRIQDDGQILLSDPLPESRLFGISPDIDFIDVNEDTLFTLLPDRVWLSDVDSEEAEIHSTIVSQCAGDCGSVRPAPEGCCRKEVCAELCDKVNQAAIGAFPSQVLVEFAVSQNGLVSFYPPPTRTLIPGIEFMTNLTLVDIKSGGEIKPCENQVACMRNQTKIWLRARIKTLQQALEWGFLTYQGAPSWHGKDALSVWISDDGYTDFDYTNPLFVRATIPIDVIPINSAPTIKFPGGEGCECNKATGVCSCVRVPPLIYTKGMHCTNDWMGFGITDAWPEGRGLDCKSRNESKLPNEKKQYDGYPVLGTRLQFDDIDMNDTPNGNMTLDISIGRVNAGSFTIRTLVQSVTYFQYVDDNENLHFVIRGKMDVINRLMDDLYYSANDDYSGAAPFLVSVSDENNYGICTPQASNPRYQCNRAVCKNFLSPPNLNQHFVCGSPGIDELKLTSFYTGASFPCQDIRSDGSSIVTAVQSSWSGPFSCLGCGYYVQSTRQVDGSSERNPSIPGLTRAIVDTVVGGAAACEFNTCQECNRAAKVHAGPNGDGCGWCPSFCKGVGKCMIGKYSPVFESCPAHSDGRGYRVCSIPDSGLATILGVSIPVGLTVFLLAYLFAKWIQRRHGSIAVYMKKKRFDVQFTGRRLNLVPPAGANYNQFFYLLVVYLVVGLFLSGIMESPGGPFYFQQEIYLDAATSLSFDLDNCNVRFLPTRNYDYPTNSINALKLRFAFMSHPQVDLVTDTCKPDATFYLNNTRDDSLKYTSYYCTVQILIPDDFVVPRIRINAIGLNLTTVRSGPMDPDTQNFGLDFGANEFVLSGHTMQARIANISAKHFMYDVMHGSLLATDIRYTLFGTFKTIDADMVVTSETQTSVRFWQKSNNLVCLSAPSLYVDDSCSETCAFVPQDGKVLPAVPAYNGTAKDPRDQYRVYRRRNLLQAGECDLVPGVPGYIEGCVTSSCEISESALCTCKPTCDLVPPEQLDFNGVKGYAGRCNSVGECCRTICSGHSLADMFPHKNTVRCGLCQDKNNCNPPQCGTWTPGKLEQQFWFTSESGQITVSVQDPASKPAQVHSYKGSAPTSSLSVTPDFRHTEKVGLNEIFHPGGAKGPINPWFWLRVSGPGAPPATLGSFVWLRSVRYLVLPDYLLQVVSYEQLNPKKSAGSIRLFPGYCPTFVDEDSDAMRKRIIDIYKLLTDTLQFYQQTIQFEAGALITWVPASGLPSRFILDTKTNSFAFSEVQPLTGDGDSLYNIVLLSFIFPILFSTILCILSAYFLGKWVKETRRTRLLHENVILNVVQQAKIRYMSEFDRIEAESIPHSKAVEMRGRTSMWYMLESAFMDPGAAKTMYTQFLTVTGHLLVISGPALYPWNLAVMWKDAFQAYKCEARIDKEVCFNETEIVSLAILWGIFAFSIFSGFDLGCYYLNIPFNSFRAFLRRAYYVVFGIFVWLALTMLLINVVWIFLGTLQVPRKLGVYALSPVLTLGIIAKYFAKLRRFQIRVRRTVQERLRHFGAKMSKKNFSPQVLKILLDKNVETTLQANGLSTASVLLKCVVLLFGITIILAFVFLGFQAFTDDTDLDSALVNAGIVFSLHFLIYFFWVMGDGDKDWANEQTELMADNIMEMMRKVVTAIEIQLKMANRMMAMALPPTSDDGESSSDGYSSDGYSSGDSGDALLGRGPRSVSTDGDTSKRNPRHGPDVADIIK